MSSRGTGTDFCKTCGRLLPEAETVNEKLLEEQGKLLLEINAAKKEVLDKITELKERGEAKDENEGGSGMMFNMKNLGSLQELLDQAEETEDMLLFTDKKQNVWQIIKRNDIDIANNNPNESGGEPAENNELPDDLNKEIVVENIPKSEEENVEQKHELEAEEKVEVEQNVE